MRARTVSAAGPVYELDFLDEPIGKADKRPTGAEAAMVIEGRLYATRGWIVWNITRSWTPKRLSQWLAEQRDVKVIRPRNKLNYYNVADVIAVIVAGKAQLQSKIRPSVSRVLQGSGSINEKLLNFIAASE